LRGLESMLMDLVPRPGFEATQASREALTQGLAP
jgi:hypothetical protein